MHNERETFMSDTAYHLYEISFTAGSEAGLAMVAAKDERSAFQILKNGGSRCHDSYSLVQIRDIGMSTSCTYGLLLESFVNAMEAYDAIVSVANHFIKGDKGDTVWLDAYVDDDMYLHIVESETSGVAMSLVFNEETGYLEIN